MINREVYSYISGEFVECLKPVSELSGTLDGKPFVDDDREIYDFDTVTKKLYDNRNVPTSADGLLLSNRVVEFVEFKMGFKRKITRATLDDSKLKCPKFTGVTCSEYGELLLKLGEKEVDELFASIRLKAIESYVTLDKKILPCCIESGERKNNSLFYCVVIDDYIDVMEDTLNMVADEESEDNSVTRIRNGLSRLRNHVDAEGMDYLYDEINVFSPDEFKMHLDKIL